MKRLLLLIVLALMAFWSMVSHRRTPIQPIELPRYVYANGPRAAQHGTAAHRSANLRVPVPITSAHTVSSGSNTVTGLISATEDRARADAYRELREGIADWIYPEVPLSWTPPPRLLDAMIFETRIKPIVKDYGTLYQAELKFDASPQHRAQLIEAYNHNQVERRLIVLGSSLAFVLICLAAISGYIRADEATKGYYTNRLRVLTAAAVGTAGVLIYQMVR